MMETTQYYKTGTDMTFITTDRGKASWLIAGLLVLCVFASGALGLTRIRDIARPLGERNNKLTGYGLVVGLKGTGDGGDSLVTRRPLIAFLQKLGNPVELMELNNAKNVAFVFVTAQLGRNGVRNGDKIDVYVHSMADAKSLEGGTLLMTVLRGSHHADDRVYGMAQGPITILDKNIPTTGVAKAGADIETDFMHEYVDYDEQTGQASFTLVLDDDHANFQVVKTIKMLIDEEFTRPGVQLGQAGSDEPTAVILDPKNIQIRIPPKQAATSAMFIARVMALPVELPEPEATVVINRRAKTIAITGNVEIAPVVIHVDGLTIRVLNPAAAAAPVGQQLITREWTPLNTTDEDSIGLNDLIDALDQLNVPFESKVNAIYAINRAHSLLGRLDTVD
ncbi:MAG: flagellar basal body P-ring protein FlgI [Planctomycetes bacterium]|nr:flagellar basal body P-ring protein FlgI [Planctomycetota bacterium]